MHICTFETETPASREAIWQLWTQAKHWSTWDPELDAAELSGPFKQGVTGQLKYKDGSVRTFTVIKCIMLESYVLSVQYGKGMELVITKRLQQNGAGPITLHQEWVLNGPPLTMLMQRGKKDLLYQQAYRQLEILLKLLDGGYTPLNDQEVNGKPSTAR